MERLRALTAPLIRGDSWWLRVGAAGAVLSILVQAPFTGPHYSLTWRAVVRQSHDLFGGPLGPPGSHEAKLTFRLVPPLVVRYFHLNPTAYYAVQVGLGVVTLGVVARLLERRGFSRRECLAVVAGISTTAIGAVWFADMNPQFDAIALSALVAGLVTENPVGVFAALSIACWTDERSLIAALAVVVAHWLRRDPRAVLACVGALVSYLALRLWLTVHFSIVIDRAWVGSSVLGPNIRFAPLAIAISLEGVWGLLAFGLFSLVRARRPEAPLLVTAAALSSLVAVLVYDVSRSAAYLLPTVLVAIGAGLQSLRHRPQLLASCAAACVAMPTAVVTTYPGMPVLMPLPIQLLLSLSGHTHFG
jgi:hypothetical protein